MNETTTTTLATTINASLVEPTVILALSEKPGLSRFCREFDYRGKSTSSAKLPTETSYWGAPDDHGVGVDLEFNATEATALGNYAFNTGSVTVTAAEYGVAHALTDNVDEDSAIDGAELLNLFTGTMLNVLGLAMDDDYLALYASLGSTVGTTNTNLTAVKMLSSQQGLRIRGATADEIAFVLDHCAGSDMEADLTSASASMAVYALAADRVIDYQRAPDNGMGTSRVISRFRGIPVYTSGLTDTANAGVDVISACICPSTAVNDASGATTHAQIWKRLPRFEMQRFIKSRATDLVMTARTGFAELQHNAGTQILSKKTF